MVIREVKKGKLIGTKYQSRTQTTMKKRQEMGRIRTHRAGAPWEKEEPIKTTLALEQQA